MKIKINDIDIKSIIFSGSCFRSFLEDDQSITNILKDRVINVKLEKDYIYVTSSNEDNLESIIREYFDLNRDYKIINNYLIDNNPNLKDMINKCSNYRILNQDAFEVSIGYIISQNNNVKRISQSINDICKDYGEEIEFNNKKYYLFPTFEKLKKLSKEDFRKYKVGFRDKYLVDFLSKYDSLKDIDNLSTEEALKKLMTVKGIGLKVASCILLFGYKRLDVFPIDTWVKKYMSDTFKIKDDVKEIEKYAKDHFKEYSGLVIQYMFHYNRNIKGA